MIKIPRLAVAAVTGSVLLSMAACATPSSGDSTEPDYPNRPITLIQPFSAGGGTDAIARALAVEMEESLGVPVNIEVREGGGGAIGFSAMANGKADGYTIGLATGEITTLAHLGQMTTTPDQIVGVAQVNAYPTAIVVAADAPWENVNDLIEDVRSKPGAFTASGGARGNLGDLGRAGMLDTVGLPETAIKWVATDGAAPTLQEVLAGGLDLAFTSLPEARALLESGDVRALAVFAEDRDPLRPEVPTLKEEGIDWASGGWRGIVVPAGTSEAVIERLDAATKEALETAKYKEFAETTGSTVVYRENVEFQTFIGEQEKLFGSLITKLGIAVD